MVRPRVPTKKDGVHGKTASSLESQSTHQKAVYELSPCRQPGTKDRTYTLDTETEDRH